MVCIVKSVGAFPSIKSSSLTAIVSSLFSASLRIKHITSFCYIYSISALVGNGPTSFSFTTQTVLGSLICPIIQYVRLLSSMSVFCFLILNAFRGSLDIVLATSWNFADRWSILKTNSIDLSLHVARRSVAFFKVIVHRSTWWSILTIKSKPSGYGFCIRSSHTTAKN